MAWMKKAKKTTMRAKAEHLSFRLHYVLMFMRRAMNPMTLLVTIRKMNSFWNFWTLLSVGTIKPCAFSSKSELSSSPCVDKPESSIENEPCSHLKIQLSHYSSI